MTAQVEADDVTGSGQVWKVIKGVNSRQAAPTNLSPPPPRYTEIGRKTVKKIRKEEKTEPINTKEREEDKTGRKKL